MKKTLIKTIAVLLFSTQITLAQPAIAWQKTFEGNTNPNQSTITDIIQTADGGYIGVGNGLGSGGDLPSGYVDDRDALIVKMDATGAVQWSKYWGEEKYEQANSVIQTSNGSFIIAGKTKSSFGNKNQGGSDGFVIKLDASGALQWEQFYGGTGDDEITSIRENPDGSFVFAGSTRSPELADFHGGSDVWIAKLDVNGIVIWETTKGYSGDEQANSIELTTDGGYVLAGTTNSTSATNYHNNSDIWVLKLSASGTISWQRCIGGEGSDLGGIAVEAQDGSIMVFGQSSSNDGDVTSSQGQGGLDLLLAKLDALGNLVYLNLYGGTQEEYAADFKQTPDGGFVMAGTTYSNNGDVSGSNGSMDIWLLKVNSLGNIEWQQCIGGDGPDHAYALGLTSDGGYILGGGYNMKYAWVIKIKKNKTGIDNLFPDAKINIFPNPVSDVLNIVIDYEIPQSNTITIYDITGRICHKQTIEKAENNQTQIDVSKLAIGSYYLKIVNPFGRIAKAFQVVR